MTRQPPAVANVQTLDALRRDLLALRAEHNPPTPWRVLAARWPGVPAGTLCAISKGREPHKASVRAALGLPVTAPAPVCPVHGVVHPGACPKVKPTPPAWVSTAAAWLAGRECLTPPAVRVYGRGGKAVTW